MVNEALRSRGVGRGEHAGPRRLAIGREPNVHVVRRVQAEAGVPVLGVVPGEEVGAVRARMLERAEALREIGPVLERL